MSRKNMRRITLRVTAQTAYNLEKLAAMAGYGYTGRVIDKLVRDQMVRLRLEGGAEYGRKVRSEH